MKKDSPSEEKSQAGKREDFFMIPNAVIDSGLWARMSSIEQRVYIVLAKHAHYDSGLAYPSVKRIQEFAGCSKDSVCAATKRLVEYGLITKKITSKAFNFRMAYRVLKDPKIDIHAIPWKREQCERKKDKMTGKFIRIPVGREVDTIPVGREKKDTERYRKILALEATTTPSPREKPKTKNKKEPEFAVSERDNRYATQCSPKRSPKVKSKAKKPKVPAGESAWKEAFGKPSEKALTQLKNRRDKMKGEYADWRKKNVGKKNKLFDDGLKYLNDEIAEHKKPRGRRSADARPG